MPWFSRWLARAAIVPARGRLRLTTAIVHKPAIGYIGWLGHHNLGDEAMYAAMIGLFPKCQFGQYFGEKREAVLDAMGLGGARMFKAIMLGGGTLINPSFLPLATHALNQGHELHIFGTGVGSPGFGSAPTVSLNQWTDVLRRVRTCAVRGPVSLTATERLGFAGATVIGDPALSLAIDELPRSRLRPRMIVNLSGPLVSNPSRAVGFAPVMQLAKEFAHTGGEVVAVALGGGDEALLRRFLSDASIARSAFVDARNRLDIFFNCVSGSDVLVGVRLHSAVLACCVGVPPILLAYRDKCRDFMLSMGLEDNLVPYSDDNLSRLRDVCGQLRENRGFAERILRQALVFRSIQRAYANGLESEWAS